jgi:hypothetical protein
MPWMHTWNCIAHVAGGTIESVGHLREARRTFVAKSEATISGVFASEQLK